MTEYLGFGVELEFDLAGGTSWTTLGQVRNVGGPALSRDSVESTHHASPSYWREFLKGLKDGGEVSLEVVYDPADSSHNDANGILGDFSDDTTIPAWRLTFPDSGSTSWTFDGFLTGFEPDIPFDDLMMTAVTIKVTGQPTLA